MTTTNNKQSQALSLNQFFTNSSTYGYETFAYVSVHCFHDNEQQQVASGTFLSNLKLANHGLNGNETW